MGSNPISSEIKYYLTKIKMFFYITIYSKEKTTLQKFLMFFSKLKTSTFSFLSQKQKQKHHQFVTILKSPHINKTAQEQFEYKFFTSKIVLYSNSFFLCFIIIKRILKKGFPGLKIKLSYSFDKKKQNRIISSVLNPDNVVFRHKRTKKKVKLYFFMFDSFGETYLKSYKVKNCILA